MEHKHVAVPEESIKKLRVCMYTLQYVGIYHHHRHHLPLHIASTILDLVTCSGTTSSLEVFDVPSLASFPTWSMLHNCFHSPNTLYLFISVILNFLQNWVNFKFR